MLRFVQRDRTPPEDPAWRRNAQGGSRRARVGPSLAGYKSLECANGEGTSCHVLFATPVVQKASHTTAHALRSILADSGRELLQDVSTPAAPERCSSPLSPPLFPHFSSRLTCPATCQVLGRVHKHNLIFNYTETICYCSKIARPGYYTCAASVSGV